MEKEFPRLPLTHTTHNDAFGNEYKNLCMLLNCSWKRRKKDEKMFAIISNGRIQRVREGENSDAIRFKLFLYFLSHSPAATFFFA